MLPSVPLEVNSHIEKLLDKLGVEFEPEMVTIIPEEFAQLENCFINVEEKVKRDGGLVHYGWAIFQSIIICEAERHAVWENPDGDLIDVTPREFNFKEIMFVSDNNFQYRGQLVDNVRLNISNNTVVDDYISLCETIEKIYTYGNRIGEMIFLPESEMALLKQYENLKMNFQTYIYHGGNPQSPCICLGGIKYEDCHGKSIKHSLANDLAIIDLTLGHLPRPLKP